MSVMCSPGCVGGGRVNVVNTLPWVVGGRVNVVNVLFPWVGGGRFNVVNVLSLGGGGGRISHHTLPVPLVAILSRCIWAGFSPWVDLSILTDVQAGQHCSTGLTGVP